MQMVNGVDTGVNRTLILYKYISNSQSQHLSVKHVINVIRVFIYDPIALIIPSVQKTAAQSTTESKRQDNLSSITLG